ncbi:MAG: hypothetical protein JWQ85_396 [Mucilaginibacter sp.]|nr:hypothetical protein [Mucilaginibacter sp.]
MVNFTGMAFVYFWPMSHTFHIPVLGLGFSIDTPLKVARYGISSVMSVVDDELIERMREYHCYENEEAFMPIKKTENDYRAKRITAYLNLVKKLVERQFENLKEQPFADGSDLCRYFELLPETSQLKQGYDLMQEFPDGEQKRLFQSILRNKITKGSIDVNIMAKVDKMNFNAEGDYTGDENTDALAALRGFATSELQSSVILSAGMNPRLYSYLENFPDFFPYDNERFEKKIILKVSDFRSAFIQAKFLAKKGLWVSEFRIESGLNCGGHAFATEGFLLGPILEEFKTRRDEMLDELYGLYDSALIQKGMFTTKAPVQKISVQGGIGTADENAFLRDHYHVDATGWGSPFLLVPEATNVDNETLVKLTGATESDYYLSNSSPLGILFNNFKPSSSEQQRISRIENKRPGSPCTKKFLCSNTEFTDQPICIASREYQNLKIKQLDNSGLPEAEHQAAFNTITEKICLCEGLCSSAYLKYGIAKPKENTAVAICPGPNLAYFRRTFSLDEMVGHIYGKLDVLKNAARPHMFLKELELYIDYLQKDVQQNLANLTEKKSKQLQKFKEQLLNGIDYYKTLFNEMQLLPDNAKEQLRTFEELLLKQAY